MSESRLIGATPSTHHGEPTEHRIRFSFLERGTREEVWVTAPSFFKAEQIAEEVNRLVEVEAKVRAEQDEYGD